VRTELARVMAAARLALQDEPIRWVHVETLHLTLRFLGETSPQVLEDVRRAAADAARAWRAFDLEVGGLGCFPDSRNPRVIWAGGREPSGTLAALAAELESIAQRYGFLAEPRAFSAHLTIGRVKERLSAEGGRTLGTFIEKSRGESYGIVAVRAVELFKSDLHPGGPVYTSLAHLSLAG